MTGVILVVQIVQYPLFKSIDERHFTSFHDEYRRRISLIVVPLMLLELVFAILLAIFPPIGMEIAARSGIVLLAIAWISTFLVQVPVHERLARGFDVEAIRRLVRTNWIRTVAWSARGALAVFSLVCATSNR